MTQKAIISTSGVGVVSGLFLYPPTPPPTTPVPPLLQFPVKELANWIVPRFDPIIWDMDSARPTHECNIKNWNLPSRIIRAVICTWCFVCSLCWGLCDVKPRPIRFHDSAWMLWSLHYFKLDKRYLFWSGFYLKKANLRGQQRVRSWRRSAICLGRGSNLKGTFCLDEKSSPWPSVVLMMLLARQRTFSVRRNMYDGPSSLRCAEFDPPPPGELLAFLQMSGLNWDVWTLMRKRPIEEETYGRSRSVIGGTKGAAEFQVELLSSRAYPYLTWDLVRPSEFALLWTRSRFP